MLGGSAICGRRVGSGGDAGSSSEASDVYDGRGGKAAGGGVADRMAADLPAKTPARAAAGPEAVGLVAGGDSLGGSGGLGMSSTGGLVGKVGALGGDGGSSSSSSSAAAVSPPSPSSI
jgi:hypothetical protein